MVVITLDFLLIIISYYMYTIQLPNHVLTHSSINEGLVALIASKKLQ